MRIYKPAGTIETLERLLAEPEIKAALVEHRVLPERAAQTVQFPSWLDKRLVRALHGQGIEMLYTHQADSLKALRAGEDIVVVTPTASGKSLCFNLPVLQAVAEDPAARALYLFPTKALSQDQLASFRELALPPRSRSPRASTTEIRRSRSVPTSAQPARWWSPTRTCFTARSSPITPSGSSCSSSCATS
jgi:DEAD/DEAH box helicase